MADVLQLAWDVHKVFELLLDVLDGAVGLHVKGDGLASWHLDEELSLCC